MTIAPWIKTMLEFDTEPDNSSYLLTPNKTMKKLILQILKLDAKSKTRIYRLKNILIHSEPHAYTDEKTHRQYIDLKLKTMHVNGLISLLPAGDINELHSEDWAAMIMHAGEKMFFVKLI